MGLKILCILFIILHLLHDLIVGNINGLRRVSVFLQQLGDIGIKLIFNILTIRPVCVFGFIADQFLNLFSQENVGFFRELLSESILFGHSNMDAIEGSSLKVIPRSSNDCSPCFRSVEIFSSSRSDYLPCVDNTFCVPDGTPDRIRTYDTWYRKPVL